jgi:hypothetical protein
MLTVSPLSRFSTFNSIRNKVVGLFGAAMPMPDQRALLRHRPLSRSTQPPGAKRSVKLSGFSSKAKQLALEMFTSLYKL